MKERPFALIGVNISGYSAAQLKEVMDREELPWRSFADTGPVGRGAIASRWNLSATPTYYVIDHEGVIRHKWVGSPGAKTIDAALATLIGKAEGR